MMIVGRLIAGFIASTQFCKQLDSWRLAEACGFASDIPTIHKKAFGIF
jgi:hypothetical protein